MTIRSTAALVLFGLSGIAGLGYQVSWTRMFSVGLGHEMPGLLAVVTAFFAGLALGGLLCDRRVSRSAVPGRWYAVLELIIGGWAILLAFAAPWLNEQAALLIGPEPSPMRQWLVAFLLPLVALLPATAAMGGTLPAIDRLAARLAGRGTTLAGVYAANTLGAMLGILLTAMVLIPAIGLRGTVLGLAGLNIACGLAMWLGPAADERSRPAVEHAFADPPSRGRLAAALAATGLLGLAYEVAGVRVIAQVLENTVYTYALTVAVYLGGTAIGAAAWHRWGEHRRFTGPAGFLIGGLAFAVATGTMLMLATEPVHAAVRSALTGLIGRGPASLAGETAVAMMIFGPPTLLMGATFSHLVLAARRPEGGVGRAAAVNTLAAALAPALVGVLLIPTIGGRWTLALIALGYVALLPLVAGGGGGGLRRAHLLLPGLAVLLALMPIDLSLVRPPHGMRFMPGGVREGVMATVAVAEDDRGDRVLKVNNQFNMGGTRFSFGDRRQGHIPMLLHPDPRRVLLLGVGSGLTAGATTLHGDPEVTAVELVPEVVGFLPAFDPANRLADIDRVVVADARRFVRADEAAYDVIVADLFHPARDGAGALYTREHFAAIRDRLAEGGLFCQWLPLYQIDAPVLAMIVRSFRDVFPEADAWLGTYNPQTPILGLIGRRGPAPAGLPWSLAGVDPAADGGWLDALAARRGRALAAELEQLALTRPIDLVACRIAGPPQLAALAGDAPPNLDDRPRVIHAAPWYTYATSESGLRRTEELLALPGREAFAAGGGMQPPEDAQQDRIARFMTARDRFLQSRLRMAAGDVAGGFRLLVEATAASDEFNTAASVAIAEAVQLARGTLVAGGGGGGGVQPADPAAARAVLDELIAVRPDLLEARRTRAMLDAAMRGGSGR